MSNFDDAWEFAQKYSQMCADEEKTLAELREQYTLPENNVWSYESAYKNVKKVELVCECGTDSTPFAYDSHADYCPKYKK